MVKLFMKTALVLILFSVFTAASIAAELKGYRAVFRPVNDNGGKLKIAIRSFEEDGGKKYLLIDPYTFEASISGAKLKPAGKGWKETPYIRALDRYTSPTGTLQKSGIRRAEAKGVFLTIDLCPSKKALDERLFTATSELPQGRPVPVAIAVSGLWIERHPSEFDWLVTMEKEGGLSITWVNHTHTHPYDSVRPMEENFLLTPGVDFEGEVLGAERALLEKGATPSPFFRFPGLVSSDGLIERLRPLSLIPIGADAWLAKGEVAKDGSIILVHGNGNEPAGVAALLKFYLEKDEALRKGELRLKPLTEAFTR